MAVWEIGPQAVAPGRLNIVRPFTKEGSRVGWYDILPLSIEMHVHVAEITKEAATG